MKSKFKKIESEPLSLFSGIEYVECGFNSENPIMPNAAKTRWEKLKEKNFGYEYCSTATFAGKYGIPTIPAFRGEVPKEFISFGDICRPHGPNCCLTGFEHDYMIEKLWYDLDEYVPLLKTFYCVAEPDFSLYLNTPLSIQIANTYRSHAIAYALHERGIAIMPSMSWSGRPSFEFCFDGHAKGGVVLVSTIGTLKDERSRMYFKEGFFEMLARIDPENVILYGDVPEHILVWIPKQLPIEIVNHYRFERARNHGR